MAVAVLMHGAGVWIEDECSADMLGAGGRLSCAAFEGRWAHGGQNPDYGRGSAGAKPIDGVDEGGAAANQQGGAAGDV